MSWLIRINSNTYPHAHPTRIVYERPTTTVTNLLGRPGGLSGYPGVRLEWDHMRVAALQWWTSWISSSAASVVLTSVILPDERSSTTVLGRANHTTWTSGVLHWPNTAEGEGLRVLNGENWITGVVIRITELGR